MKSLDTIAHSIFSQLTPEQIAYAKDPARGDYAGFPALHDIFDANALLPDDFTSEACDRAAAIMDRVTMLILG